MSIFEDDKKAIKAAYDATHYLANKERMNTKSAAYNKANKIRLGVYKEDWLRANKERVIAWHASNYIKNKARMNALGAAWKKANPKNVRVYSHNRRALKMAAGEKLSTGLSDKLFKLQRGKCACGCKQPLGDNYQLDHIMPIALGGSNSDNNIQLLLPTCNRQKWAKHPADFMRQRGFLL